MLDAVEDAVRSKVGCHVPAFSVTSKIFPPVIPYCYEFIVHMIFNDACLLTITLHCI